MLISGSIAAAFDNVAVRESDVLQAYAPGAVPVRSDVGKTGTATASLDPLSVAAPTDAYFITCDDRGRALFTRDGSFAVQNGALVDAQGRPILGYAKPGAPLAPLHADSVDAALGYANTAHIASDGSVAYERSAIDPRTGQRETQVVSIGRLALARFAPGTKLQNVDPQHAVAPAGVAPHIGCAGTSGFGAVSPFTRSGSGIDIDAGLQRLQEAYLALDALRAADKAFDGTEKTAMDLLK